MFMFQLTSCVHPYDYRQFKVILVKTTNMDTDINKSSDLNFGPLRCGLQQYLRHHAITSFQKYVSALWTAPNAFFLCSSAFCGGRHGGSRLGRLGVLYPQPEILAPPVGSPAFPSGPWSAAGYNGMSLIQLQWEPTRGYP